MALIRPRKRSTLMMKPVGGSTYTPGQTSAITHGPKVSRPTHLTSQAAKSAQLAGAQWTTPTGASAASPAAAIPKPEPVPQQSVTPIQAVPPVATPQGINDRVGAENTYTNTLDDVNRQIMQAALRYGGAPQVTQFGTAYDGKTFDPNNPFAGISDTQNNVALTTQQMADPLNALSTIGRNYDQYIKSLHDQTGENNTYFSSQRLGTEKAEGDDSDRQRAQAKRDYENAVSDLMSQLTGARTSRDSTFRDALLADLQAASSQDPEAQAADTPAAPAAPVAPAADVATAPRPVSGSTATTHHTSHHTAHKPSRKPRRRAS